MRYVGQHHEVSVDIPSDCRIEQKHLPIIAEAFHKAHEKLYTYSTPENPLEIMNLRITAVGAVQKTGLFEHPIKGPDPAKAFKHKRKLHFQEPGGFVEVPVYDRDLLVPGNVVPGPAVIEERIHDHRRAPPLGRADRRVRERRHGGASVSAQQRKKEFEGARDPITLSVIYNRLLTINQEMGITMINTSISPIFAEVHDFSCAICDWDNRIVAQIDGVPSHTASVMESVKAVSREFGGDINAGDVFVLNDPYLGGTHLPDITIMKPIFYEGKLQFIAINRAHHGDVGGIEPGSYVPSARELFHEGIRIPPLRIYKEEKPIARRGEHDPHQYAYARRPVGGHEGAGGLPGWRRRGSSSSSASTASRRRAPRSRTSTPTPSAGCARRSRSSPTACTKGKRSSIGRVQRQADKDQGFNQDRG